MNMTASQTAAVARIRSFVESELNKNAEYGDTITEWEVKIEDWAVVVRAQTDMVKLPLSNMLRFVEHKYFLFFVGKRGGVTMAMGPDSLKQFNGRKFHGFNIKF